MSKHQTQLGRVRLASGRGVGGPNLPCETKTSGANGGRKRTQVYANQLQKQRKYLPGSGGAQAERDGAEHDGKGATTMTRRL